MDCDRSALQIPLILSEIFRKLTLEDQKNFRLVSKTWRDSTLGYWRNNSSAVVVVSTLSSSKKHFGEFLRYVKKGRDQFHRVEEYPFRQFSIQVHGNPNVLKRGEDIYFRTWEEKQFWELIGPSIEYLESVRYGHVSILTPEGIKSILLDFGLINLKELVLTRTPFALIEQSRTLLSDFKFKLNKNPDVLAAKNLKRLKIMDSLHYLSDPFDEERRQIEHKSILDIVPNLKSITSNASCDELLKALPSHAASCDPENYIKLETLILEKHSPEPEVCSALKEYMKKVKPSFKQLKLDVDQWNRDEPPFYLHQFVESCANTLTNLKLKFYPDGDDDDVVSPWLTDLTGLSFPNLTRLHLTFFEEEKCDFEFLPKFDFEAFRGMPMLHSFVCVSNKKVENFNGRLSQRDLKYKGAPPAWIGNQVERDVADIEMNKLQEFHYCLTSTFGAGSLKKLGSWMKNMKRLKVVLNEETFQVIPQAFPALEELTLLDGSCVGKDSVERVRAAKSSLIVAFENENYEEESEQSDEDSKDELPGTSNAKNEVKQENSVPLRRSQRIKKP